MDANGIITPADVVYVLNRIGDPLDASNVRADVDQNGVINQADVDAISDRIGQTAE
ncbi:MAG: hypothetical protein AAF653_14810 [Chloroflexota bacterium]